MRRRKFLASVTLAAGIGFAAAPVAAPSVAHAGLGSVVGARVNAGWETIARENGVTVSTRQEEGREFPTFRGKGRVEGSVLEILAVVTDANRQTEWMHNCADARIVEKIDGRSQFVYNRTDAPWPVKDRDVVLLGRFTIEEGGKEAWVKFASTMHSDARKKKDVVRMNRLSGHYHIVAIDDDTSRVTYQVNADPAGALPNWLVKQITKDLPLHTLMNLRRQVKKARGDYDLDAKYGDYL